MAKNVIIGQSGGPTAVINPRLQAALYTPARLELITAVGPPLWPRM